MPKPANTTPEGLTPLFTDEQRRNELGQVLSHLPPITLARVKQVSKWLNQEGKAWEAEEYRAERRQSQAQHLERNRGRAANRLTLATMGGGCACTLTLGGGISFTAIGAVCHIFAMEISGIACLVAGASTSIGLGLAAWHYSSKLEKLDKAPQPQ